MIDSRQFPFSEWMDKYVKSFVEGREIGEFVATMNADYWLINYKYLPILEWFSRSGKWSPAFLGPIGAVFVPASQFGGKSIVSIKILSLINKTQISRVLNAAGVLGKMSLAKEIAVIAENNIDNDDIYKEQYLRDIGSFLLGLQALSDQEYEVAANHFSNAHLIRYSLNRSAKLYRYLASSAWQQKDYINARKWSIAAYDVLPDKTLLDIYNIAITDWHVRKDINPELLTDRREYRWENCADVLIKEREMLPVNQKSIIKTLVSMKKGLYEGDAELFQDSIFDRHQAALLESGAAEAINKVELQPIH
jgi:hypothetical protein